MRPEVEGLAGASNCKTRIFCWELGGHDVFSGVHIVIILCIDWCAETTNNWTDPFAQTPIVSAEVKTWHWLTDYPTSCIDSFSVKLCAIFVWCDSMWCPFSRMFHRCWVLRPSYVYMVHIYIYYHIYIYIHIIILYYIQYIYGGRERERERAMYSPWCSNSVAGANCSLLGFWWQLSVVLALTALTRPSLGSAR